MLIHESMGESALYFATDIDSSYGWSYKVFFVLSLLLKDYFLIRKPL